MSEARSDDAGGNGEGEVRSDEKSSDAAEPHASDLAEPKSPPGRSRSERVSLVLSVLAVVIAGMSAWFTWRQADEAGRQADEAKRQADAAQHANDLADSATARKIRVERILGLDNALIVENQSDQRAESMWLEGENDVVKVTIDLFDLAPCKRFSSNANSTIGGFLKSQSYMAWTLHFAENGRRWEREESQLPKRVDEKTIIRTTFNRSDGFGEVAIQGC